MRIEERTEFEKVIFRIFNTNDGKFLMEELEKGYVYTDIVQTDGQVPSAIREGKSELVRFLQRTYLNQIDE